MTLKIKTPPIPSPPSIHALLRHLAACPDIFLQEPRQGTHGNIYVGAVVSDLLWSKRKTLLTDDDLKTFSTKKSYYKNYLRQVLICCWLFNHRYFQSNATDSNKMLSFLKDGLFLFLLILFFYEK